MLDLQRRLQMLRQALLREHLLRPVRRELLVFSVALDRDPVEPIDPVARVVLDQVVVVLDLEDPGRIGHRVSTPLEPRRACARDLVRMQLVRRWDRDLRVPWVKLAPKVIVRRDSSEDRVPSEDRGLIVDRDLRVLKVQQLIDRRDPKVLRVIDRRDPKVVVASSEDHVPTEDRDPIIEDRDPKVLRGRRKGGHRRLVLQFRRPNPRRRNKLQNPLPRRRRNQVHQHRNQRRSQHRTS